MVNTFHWHPLSTVLLTSIQSFYSLLEALEATHSSVHPIRTRDEWVYTSNHDDTVDRSMRNNRWAISSWPSLTSTPATVSQCQCLIFAARPLQLAAGLIAPPVWAAHRLPLCSWADDPTVTVSVSNQPLQRNTATNVVSSVVSVSAGGCEFVTTDSTSGFTRHNCYIWTRWNSNFYFNCFVPSMSLSVFCFFLCRFGFFTFSFPIWTIEQRLLSAESDIWPN